MHSKNSDISYKVVETIALKNNHVFIIKYQSGEGIVNCKVVSDVKAMCSNLKSTRPE